MDAYYSQLTIRRKILQAFGARVVTLDNSPESDSNASRGTKLKVMFDFPKTLVKRATALRRSLLKHNSCLGS